MTTRPPRGGVLELFADRVVAAYYVERTQGRELTSLITHGGARGPGQGGSGRSGRFGAPAPTAVTCSVLSWL